MNEIADVIIKTFIFGCSVGFLGGWLAMWGFDSYLKKRRAYGRNP